MGSELREEMELMCSSAKINKQNAIVESTKNPSLEEKIALENVAVEWG